MLFTGWSWVWLQYREGGRLGVEAISLRRKARSLRQEATMRSDF